MGSKDEFAFIFGARGGRGEGAVFWQRNGGAREWPEICNAEAGTPQRFSRDASERIFGDAIRKKASRFRLKPVLPYLRWLALNFGRCGSAGAGWSARRAERVYYVLRRAAEDARMARRAAQNLTPETRCTQRSEPLAITLRPTIKTPGVQVVCGFCFMRC